MTDLEADIKIDQYFYNKMLKEIGFDKPYKENYTDTFYYHQLRLAYENKIISKMFYERRIKELREKYENT